MLLLYFCSSWLLFFQASLIPQLLFNLSYSCCFVNASSLEQMPSYVYLIQAHVGAHTVCTHVLLLAGAVTHAIY